MSSTLECPTTQLRLLEGRWQTCRLAYPPQMAAATYYAEIMAGPSKPKDLVPIRRFPRTVLGQETISDPPVLNEALPVDPDDERIIASGLRRTNKIDQMQAESNPLTTSLMRCNSSMQPTTSPTEARNAVFYSSKYCSKNPYRLSSTLSLLYTAQ